ncbi:hypothetical protein JCGZ_13171 [Jatropha curcas]|uniref:Uncharacterized protein n=1 Tax=Jatropha curcas TaxID=180498 RepID=A0A067K8R2_JATCU|nr:hypothetical protein JCGZ_13171 [Jatropha curcas]
MRVTLWGDLAREFCEDKLKFIPSPVIIVFAETVARWYQSHPGVFHIIYIISSDAHGGADLPIHGRRYRRLPSQSHGDPLHPNSTQTRHNIIITQSNLSVLPKIRQHFLYKPDYPDFYMSHKSTHSPSIRDYN